MRPTAEIILWHLGPLFIGALSPRAPVTGRASLWHPLWLVYLLINSKALQLNLTATGMEAPRQEES